MATHTAVRPHGRRDTHINHPMTTRRNIRPTIPLLATSLPVTGHQITNRTAITLPTTARTATGPVRASRQNNHPSRTDPIRTIRRIRSGNRWDPGYNSNGEATAGGDGSTFGSRRSLV
ncbi:hypothetical protein SPI_06356 [Niveomyces insectorum RCEF 264]|uniref:Uncharacterized protein n=1 Tax=Niveomyces insectorum RCEF 264 TaxID=1081102 RepID=A0A167S1Y3_9HYPO|nr:hypothetical protein SPI_06356 [Niveomyces insectorum RCEF 264]